MLYHHIPQELNDEIIGFLWDDKAALKSCALTCHSFLPASQKQLFSDISVYSSESAQRIPTSSNLRRVLEDAPYLAQYVHRLEICDLCHPGQTTEWRVDDQDLIFCLRSLFNLTALKIYCRDGKLDASRWVDIRRGGLFMALLETMKLPTLTCLDFNSLPFSLASQCPTLKYLTLRSPDTDLVIDTPLPISTYVYPESLHLDLREPSDTSRKFERTVTVNWGEEIRKGQIELTELKALSIITNAREWEEHCGAWAVLKASAATLQTLALEVEASSGMFVLDTPFNARPVVEDPLDWSSLKALRVLQARVTVVAADDQWGLGFCNLLPWVFGLLRALTSSGSSDIEELVIQVNYQFLDKRRVPVLLPWKDLLAFMFQRARFPRLQRIHVMIASESAVPFQSIGIVQQIRKYARMMMHTGSCQRVSVSFSSKFYDDATVPLPMENFTTCM